MDKKTLNALKISISAIFSIFFSYILDLDFYISAGIVTILTIAPTKKETFKTAIDRLLAFFVALIIAFLCFSLLDYTIFGFFMYLLIFIIVCQKNNLGSAMAMNSVLISHFLTFEKMTYVTVCNEILLFFIGAGFGILANLHLRENTDFMEKMETETDEQIKTILSRMSKRITNHNIDDYNGDCFTKIRISLRIANEIAERNFMNQLRKKTSFDIQYIAMREQQTLVLYNIYKRARNLKTTPDTAKSIAEFLDFLSNSFGKSTSADVALAKFNILQRNLASSPLPVTREEFEARAELYAILGCIKEFILIKKDFLIEVEKSV